MAVSKVVLGDETLIDLTGDSVSSENLLQGATAHAANGEQITGGVVVTPMYTGTKAAIEEAIALGQIPEDAVVNITDDEETSSFQTQINEINSSLDDISNSLDKLATYSISEIDTGRKWIDGKTIYRKNICYDFDTPVSDYNNIIDDSIKSTDVDTLLLFISAERTSINNAWLQNHPYSPSNRISIELLPTGVNASIVGIGSKVNRVTVMLEYTKA